MELPLNALLRNHKWIRRREEVDQVLEEDEEVIDLEEEEDMEEEEEINLEEVEEEQVHGTGLEDMLTLLLDMVLNREGEHASLLYL